MKETHTTRALILSFVLLLSVTTAPVLGTTVSKTTIADPGTNEPVPGDTQTVLELTISSDDLVKTAGDGSAGDPTASFNAGTTNTPEMYVDDSTSGGYQDGDDVLRLNRIYPSSGGGLDGATIADFSTSESYISPAGNAFDGSQAVVDSGDGILDSTAEIDKDGTAGVLTGLAGTGVQFHEDAAGGAGYDAVNGAYGEAIYNTGGDGTVDGTDTRVTAVTVNSGTGDGDVGTVDLGLSTLSVVGSADVDTGKSLTAAGITPAVAYINASGDTSFSTGDTVAIDMTSNGQTSDDIILVDNGGFTGGGDAYTGTLTGAWDTIDASSVAFDNGNDGAASVVQPDVVISGGTATIVTAGVTYGVDVGTTNGPVIQYWDIDGNTALGSTESVYIDEDDTGTVSSDDANPSDFRLRGFSKTLPAGPVGSTDVDVGISATDFETDEYYLDDDATGPYANGDAIIVNGGTAGNLEAADTVVVTGSISGSARTFSDGTSGDAVMFVGTNDFDGSQDILGVTRVVNGGSDTALSGTTLNTFANDVGYVDTANLGRFDAAETIFQEGDASSGLGTIFGDTVTDITVTNDGTLGTQNISSVSLDIGGTDITSTSSASNGVYAFTGITSNNIVGPGGTSATVTVTLTHDAPAGKTLNFSVSTVVDAGTTGTYDSGDSGMFFEQAAPVGDISNGADITIDAASSVTAKGISFSDPTDSDHVKVELAFNTNLDPATTETSDFTVYDEDGDTVAVSALEDDDSDGRLVLDLGTGTAAANIETVAVGDSVVQTGSGGDIAGQNVSVTATSTTVLESAPTSYNAYKGEQVAIYADSDGNLDEDILVEADTDGDGTFETFVFDGNTGQNSQLYVFESSGRDAGTTFQFTYQSSDGDPGEHSTLTLRDLGLTVTADALEITSDDALTASISANAGNRDVESTLVDSNDDEVSSTTITLDGAGEGTVDFGTVDPGNYTVEVTDVDSGVTTTTETIRVMDSGAATAGFTETVVSVDQGDVATIAIDVSNTDTATVQVGSEDVNYVANVTVSDGDGDGEVVLEFNTFDAGTGSSPFAVADADDSIVTSDQGSLTDLVDPGSYDLSVQAGSDAGAEAQDLATLSIQDRSTDTHTTWTAPGGTTMSAVISDGTLTETDSITSGDWQIHQVEASGIFGLLASTFGDNATARFTNAVGNDDLNLTIEQTNPGANRDPLVLDLNEAFDTDAYAVVLDAGNSTVYIVFDTTAQVFTRDGDSTFAAASDGQHFNAIFTVESGSGPAAADESVHAEYSIQAPSTTIDYEGDDVVVFPQSGQAISGETNYAPGTTLSIRARSSSTDAPFIKTAQSLTVHADGRYSGAFDFSDVPLGTEFTVSVRKGTPEVASATGVVQEEAVTTTTTETTTQTTPEATTVMTTEATTEATTKTTTEPPTEEPTTTSIWTPGFGIAVVMLALIGAALIALRRRD